jgi:hypothetical protein
VSQRENTHNSDKYEFAKRYWYDKRRNTWVVEIKGITKYTPVKTPEIAERIVKRLMLGFPLEVAKMEAINPTISISNWKQFQIKYDDYIRARDNGVTIKSYRREQKNGKKVYRGPAKKGEND